MATLIERIKELPAVALFFLYILLNQVDGIFCLYPLLEGWRGFIEKFYSKHAGLHKENFGELWLCHFL